MCGDLQITVNGYTVFFYADDGINYSVSIHDDGNNDVTTAVAKCIYDGALKCDGINIYCNAIQLCSLLNSIAHLNDKMQSVFSMQNENEIVIDTITVFYRRNANNKYRATVFDGNNDITVQTFDDLNSLFFDDKLFYSDGIVCNAVQLCNLLYVISLSNN